METPRHNRLKIFAMELEVTRHYWPTEETPLSRRETPQESECVRGRIPIVATNTDSAEHYAGRLAELIVRKNDGTSTDFGLRLIGDFRSSFCCVTCGRAAGLTADFVAPVHEPEAAPEWLRESINVIDSDYGYTADGHMAGTRVACGSCVDAEYTLDAEEVVPACARAAAEERMEARRESLWTAADQWFSDVETAGVGVLG